MGQVIPSFLWFLKSGNPDEVTIYHAPSWTQLPIRDFIEATTHKILEQCFGGTSFSLAWIMRVLLTVLLELVHLFDRPCANLFTLYCYKRSNLGVITEPYSNAQLFLIAQPHYSFPSMLKEY